MDTSQPQMIFFPTEVAYFHVKKTKNKAVLDLALGLVERNPRELPRVAVRGIAEVLTEGQATCFGTDNGEAWKGQGLPL